MKKLLVLLAILIGSAAQADKVDLKINATKGKLTVKDGLKINGVNLRIENQFCNIAGTTCAGGPSHSDSEEGVLTTSGLLSFPALALKSGHLFNKFSSCKVIIEVVADDNGVEANGSSALIFQNGEEECNNSAEINKELSAKFAKGLVVSKTTTSGLIKILVKGEN